MPTRQDEDELTNELNWAADRPGSRWRSEASGADESGAQRPDPYNPDMWEQCLTEWEFDAYEAYKRQCPVSVYSLNQNPASRATYAKGQASVLSG